MGGVYRRAPMGARTTLTDAWPLFGLRLRTERLVLRLPTDDDLVPLMALARAGIHPPDEMPFGVAWSTIPSPAFERSFMQHHWRCAVCGRRPTGPSTSSPFDGDPIGSQCIDAEAFAVYRRSTGSWLGQAFQGRGFGKEMRAAVLGFAFDGLGARVAETEAFLDNAASNGVSRTLGYEPNGFGDGARGRRARDPAVPDDGRGLAVATAAAGHHRGLDACRDLFGAEPTADRLEPAARASAAAAHPPPPNPPRRHRPTTTASSRSSRAPTSCRRRRGCPNRRRGCRRCRPTPRRP